MNEAPIGVTGTMTLVNQTKIDIENVLITRCNDRSFAARRNDEQIAPGDKYTFTLLPGCWIMRIGNRTARHTFGVLAGEDMVIEYRGN